MYASISARQVLADAVAAAVPYPDVRGPLRPVEHRAAAVERPLVQSAVLLLRVEEDRVALLRPHREARVARVHHLLLP
eukprot:CAMPEP_0182533792 /NCGR_PEP_ID=MMETSP1323-20130603/14383_1 /TAXON_ID=236787 /ORGANISM="Florenciella parvula, Strain RCC1693" /LENGTH=77 /DNA_ID=CAMNT_0024743717 /DNA_START=18 /DNA_END=247 /DNA_ORIENTATION=+